MSMNFRGDPLSNEQIYRRVRHTAHTPSFAAPLSGEVEADTTFAQIEGMR